MRLLLTTLDRICAFEDSLSLVLVLDQKSENGWISMWNVKIMSMFKLHLMSRRLKSLAGSKLMCMEHITWRSCILRFIWNVNSKWHVTAKCVSNVCAPQTLERMCWEKCWNKKHKWLYSNWYRNMNTQTFEHTSRSTNIGTLTIWNVILC